MTTEEIKEKIHQKELIYATSRSGGPGGQNVNKVNTKVELRFNVVKSLSLTETEKSIILIKLKNRINSDDELLIISQSERTQLMNRKRAFEKFCKLLASALTLKQKRTKTKPTKASKEKRLEKKKKKGTVKRLRSDRRIGED